jgi:hypothetical protein
MGWMDMKRFKVGDVIRSRFGRHYEIVPTTEGAIAVYGGNYVCLYKYWPECELVGNVRDNPELKCARIQTND